MSKYTLTYEKSKSQEIYIEGVVKNENHVPYFEQEYDEARKLIKEIVDSQGTKEDSDNEREKKREKIKKYGYNNRILFIGQRGCGKTSVMHSLADFLSGKNPKLKEKDGKDAEIQIKFSCLPMVDPSHFDNNNNILLTVITSMFSEAKRKMNKDEDGGDTSIREELLKQFEKVFKSLDSIKSELSSYTLESLNRKSDAEDLRDKMNKLVEKYLKYLDVGEDSRLVLLIDDIDMSVSHAPEMLEQLRKYLELDNLIILMSANLGQLSNEMREKYSSAFQYTLKDSNQALSIDVEDLATKYLLKLFPTSRRINVERHVSQLLKTTLVIMDAPQNGNEAKKEPIANDDFQKVILSLIWRKTRLLFIPKDSENTLHPIIPTNLRDLAQFLDMLTALSDIGSKYKYEKDGQMIEESRLFAFKKDYEMCEHNLHVFRNYVMKTWIPNHLKVDEELVFHNIPTDIAEINKHLINSINIIGTKHKDDMMSRQVSLDMIERNAEGVNIDRDIYTMVSPNDPKFVKANKISDIFNQPSNYSYGDLLLMIDKYETYFESEEHRSFTDAIKIYYSILLFETMFFMSNNVVYDIYGEVARSFSVEEKKEIESNYLGTNVEDFVQLKKLVQNICEKDGQEDKDMMIINKRNELMSRKIPIQKLIGGNVYYPNYFEIITDKNFNQKGPSFDAKRAFYHKVKIGKNEKVGNTYPLFSVLYYGDIRPDRYEKDHIYDTTFNKNADVDGESYVTFDILSILNNMLNPCHTLSRLDNGDYRPNDWKTIIEKIKDWGEYNKIEEEKETKEKNSPITTPNAILPFYAVDLMLSYLRHDYSTQELFEASKTKIPNIRNAKAIANYVSVFFDHSSSSLLVEIIQLLKDMAKQEPLSADRIAEKYFKAVEYKNKLESIIENNGSLSPDEKDILLNKILGNTMLVFKNQSEFEGFIENTTKEDIHKITSELWVSCEDKCVLEELFKGDKEINTETKKTLKNILTKYWITEKEKNQLNDENAFMDAIKNIVKKIYVSDKEKLLRNVYYAINETEIDNDNVRLLIENVEIILEAQQCYNEISLSEVCKTFDHIDSLTDLYRNHVIAIILGKPLITKKEKEALVKELRKFSTVSEIYRHIVEVMWENRIKEMCIRGNIQEKVRSPRVVQAYYGKLWEETQGMFESIGIQSISIYKNLFTEAENYFLNNDLPEES